MTKGYGAGAKLKQPRYVTLDGDKVQAEYWSSLRVGQRSMEGCLVAYASTYRLPERLSTKGLVCCTA
jgi:hypothetical protein